MTAVDHAELKRLAEGATPGPWNNSGRSVDDFDAECMMRMEWIANGPADDDDDDDLNANVENDAAFIAAANPAVVLALLSEIEGLKAEREEARPWHDRKDEWSEAISAAHPVNSDHPWKHKCFEMAMKMVGTRHGKYELVALVSWLLSDLKSLRTQAPDSWRPDREGVAREILQAFRDFDECRAAGDQIIQNTADRILALRPQTAESWK